MIRKEVSQRRAMPPVGKPLAIALLLIGVLGLLVAVGATAATSQNRTPFAGEWEVTDTTDGSLITLQLVQPAGQLLGLYKDEYDDPPVGERITPGFAGTGSGTTLSETEARMSFELVRGDGATGILEAKLVVLEFAHQLMMSELTWNGIAIEGSLVFKQSSGMAREPSPSVTPTPMPMPQSTFPPASTQTVTTADLQLTDIYESGGNIFVKITNNGPDALTNASVSLETSTSGTSTSGVIIRIGGITFSPSPQASGSPQQKTVNVTLKQGETVDIDTGVDIGTKSGSYTVTCTLSATNDPDPANNTRQETIQGASAGSQGPSTTLPWIIPGGQQHTPTPDISGTWIRKSGGQTFTYKFTQSGNSFTWKFAQFNETATGTINGTKISVSWKGGLGTGSNTGTIILDSKGVPTQIKMDRTGNVFERPSATPTTPGAPSTGSVTISPGTIPLTSGPGLNLQGVTLIHADLSIEAVAFCLGTEVCVAIRNKGPDNVTNANVTLTTTCTHYVGTQETTNTKKQSITVTLQKNEQKPYRTGFNLNKKGEYSVECTISPPSWDTNKDNNSFWQLLSM